MAALVSATVTAVLEEHGLCTDVCDIIIGMVEDDSMQEIIEGAVAFLCRNCVKAQCNFELECLKCLKSAGARKYYLNVNKWFVAYDVGYFSMFLRAADTKLSLVECYGVLPPEGPLLQSSNRIMLVERQNQNSNHEYDADADRFIEKTRTYFTKTNIDIKTKAL